MRENLFGLPKMNHLSEILVTLLNRDICALTFQNRRLIIRKDIEHEIQFIYKRQFFTINFKANRKYLSVISTYPLKGIISSVNHDGSFVQNMQMGYLYNQELQLSEKGEMNLSFLINDILNTADLIKINPGIIAGYYFFLHEKLKKEFPKLFDIRNNPIPKNSYITWISDTVRKKHLFSYNGVNIYLSFQAIIENHPEIFNHSMN
jgi:hypothetical protein